MGKQVKRESAKKERHSVVGGSGAKAGEEPKDAVKHAAGQALGRRETLSREEEAKLSGKPGQAGKNEIPTR